MGGRKVLDVLRDLDIDPDTVLVIRDRELLTREDRVGEQERIEVRPVISGGAGRASREEATEARERRPLA